jgi:hypothetical protein
MSRDEFEVTKDRPRDPIVVDVRGNPTKLSDYQKNHFHSEAKKLQDEIKGSLCSRDECRNPTDRNVQKMLKSEFPISQKIEGFKKRMQALGADPREYNVEKFRR